MSALVEIRNSSKVYTRGKQKLEVLHHVNIDIEQGGFLALMGPSGSGKTTLLNLIGGLDSPTDGTITVAERRIHRFGQSELARWRACHKPAGLPGGQQQRVAIARAIVFDPKLLVCDEPTRDLDRQSAAEVLTLLQHLNREQGKTIVMVTHDPKAAEYATHTLHKGTLVETAEAAA
jgi:putative ABC transport system ATP-binding protein